MSVALDTEDLGEKAFQGFVSAKLPFETLEQLSGDHFYASRHAGESGLMKRVRIAWTKPLCELSCAEVRTLVLQKLGLAWLASAIVDFVTRNPTADCGMYPGDLTVASLLAWRELHEIAPLGTRRMVASNFRFLEEDEDARNPRSIIGQAMDALSRARSHFAPSQPQN